MNTPDLLKLALERTCPAGLPHTGDAPQEDHGHTDCWVIHQLMNKIIELDNVNQKLAAALLSHHVHVDESHVEQVDEALAAFIGRHYTGEQ